MVLLNSWASCAHPAGLRCHGFQNFEGLREPGLAVIGVSLDHVWPVPAVSMDTSKVLYPLVVGHEDLAKRYGITSLPAPLLIDRKAGSRRSM